jgi:hypothetical protein
MSVDDTSQVGKGREVFWDPIVTGKHFHDDTARGHEHDTRELSAVGRNYDVLGAKKGDLFLKGGAFEIFEDDAIFGKREF